MKIKYINLNRNYDKTKLYKIKKLLFIMSMPVLVGCSNKNSYQTIEPIEITKNIEPIKEDKNDIVKIEEIKEDIKESIESTSINEEVTDKKIVALTFDDGPGKYTEQLVEILKENDANATFFVLGTCVERYKDAVLYAYENGNEIAIHGYSHTSFKKMTIEEIQNEIDLTKQLIEESGAESSNLVRPPGGNINSKIVDNISSSFILWNIDTRDWEFRNVESIKGKVIDKIEDGDIILFHDIYKTTIDAIKEILPELKDEYQLVTVSELFELKQQEYEENKKYYKVK